jgi:dienelactone hydrolase
MATVVLLPSVLGVRAGVDDAAVRLRGDGHDVVVADYLDGARFDDYPPAMAHVEAVGHSALLGRAVSAAVDVPDGFVVAGFSLGCVMAMHLATVRQASGILLLAGAIPPSGFGDGRSWPAGVPGQTHSTLDDPWREQDAIDQAVVEAAAAGARLEVFDYPGAGHLFTDPTLPDEYDAAATELLWSRVLPFARDPGA